MGSFRDVFKGILGRILGGFLFFLIYGGFYSGC